MAQALLVITLSPLMMGASGSVLTGTGSTMTSTVILTEKEMDTSRDARAASIKTFAANMKEWQKIRTAWRNFVILEDASASSDRSLCRAEIRQANRDTLLATQVRCFRREMSTWRTRLIKEEAFMIRTPGLSPVITTAVLDRSRALRESINAVIAALDNNVFSTEAQLREAKRNLRSKYLLPLRLALEALRLHEARLINQWIILRIDAEDNDGRVHDRTTWDHMRQCFTENETSLNSLEQQTSALLTCIHWAQDSLPLQTPPAGAGSALTATGSSIPAQQ